VQPVASAGKVIHILLLGFHLMKMEGTGYEARKTSKKQTKMPRFMLEGPRPHAKSFVLRSYAVHELRYQHIAIG